MSSDRVQKSCQMLRRCKEKDMTVLVRHDTMICRMNRATGRGEQQVAVGQSLLVCPEDHFLTSLFPFFFLSGLFVYLLCSSCSFVPVLIFNSPNQRGGVDARIFRMIFSSTGSSACCSFHVMTNWWAGEKRIRRRSRKNVTTRRRRRGSGGRYSLIKRWSVPAFLLS